MSIVRVRTLNIIAQEDVTDDQQQWGSGRYVYIYRIKILENKVKTRYIY